MSAPTPDASTWGACRFCGVAVEPGAAKCGICGAEDPVAAGEIKSAPPSVRRRIYFTGAFRAVIVVGLVLTLAVSLLTTVFQGPPNVADPLTTTGTYAIGPGNHTVISGEITGGDFVLGNYSAITPPGVNVTVSIYNQTQWDVLLGGGLPGSPLYSGTPGPDGRIVYSAPVTDTYYFVFGNPYPVGSGITINVYIATQYVSNVAADGFG